MKLTIPPTITIQFAGQPFGPFTFADLVRHVVETDTRTNQSGAGIRAGMRIELACLGDPPKEPGTEVDLSKEDLALLRDMIDAPTGGLPSLIQQAEDGSRRTIPFGRQLLPYIEHMIAACKA